MAIHIHGGLRGLRIARLLAHHPELANDHDFTVLGSVSWMYLLTFQPRFADKCDKWDEIERHSPYFVAKVRNGKGVENKIEACNDIGVVGGLGDSDNVFGLDSAISTILEKAKWPLA